MKKNYFTSRKLQSCLLFFMILTATVSAQVGVGTITPDASSVLDVSSTTQGMLTPRMTTAQKNAIASPADGLMVYDTDLKAFCYYNQSVTAWTQMNSATTGRLKFKRIKSSDVLSTVLAAELANGGGSKYVLDSGTYYEINGTINVNFPIDLNNAYLVGLDANEDVLFKSSGTLFEGATGGTVKNLGIAGGSAVFNLVASGNTQTFIFRDSIVSGSANVGTISGFGLVFFSVINYSGNTTGITFGTSTRVLLSNTAWFGNNTGTFEKFTGTFSFIQKQGGFCEVNGSAMGVDVSSNPIITGDAVMESVVFTGTNTEGYVGRYATGSYAGYNFNNSWNVRCAGIPTETDAVAAGDFTFDYPVGQGVQTTFSGSSINPTAILKVAGVSASTNLFRFSTGGVSNRLVYDGKKKRLFQVTGSISFQVPNPGTYIIYIAKNNQVINQFKIYGRGLITNDIVIVPLDALVELSNSDYVEVYAQRLVSTFNGDSIITPNLTLIVK
ncbi:hypothetical protein [Flavobacterium turcicum]|uniref:Uncharacterized protein n=1 Tax=Flavobacterium turcicum TaxID=2764718 RepID=A0ABR7JCV2_9FLAO|nr:hypothetical protein [Flavobacterium turcicum]MBC5862322.1 hypothetical protein [Flavobacterium turcicum]NHL01053.1 hypothetical protein [Flavobacterium turcicum]